ncbi:MAG: ABC transporter substrate-binding protein [Candidatus Methanoplasma sp.]|jgi:iron complex transport system substrate-binding protein|nr:ABC transporter substrate-binding protein [Candidatus Methanoplasma sp.]
MNGKALAVIAVAALTCASVGLFYGLRSDGSDGHDEIEITDMVGDRVTIRKNPSKVAVLARSAVDMMVAFGLGDRIDGVYYTVLDNAWAKFIYPESEGYFKYSYDTTVETYVSRGVDLVIAPEKYIADNLRSHGIDSFTVSQYGNPNYDGSVFAFAEIVRSVWDGGGAGSKIDDWERGFDEVRSEILSKVPGGEAEKSVYYVRGDKNKGIRYTENSEKTVQNTFAKYLGLDYVGKSYDSSEPTAERLLADDPDYIIVGGAYQNRIIADAKSDPVWKNLSAVKGGRIFNIGVGFVMFEQNSVELTIYLADLANKIYPDRFAFDVPQMLKDCMLKYFGKEISDGDAENMLSGRGPDGESLA